MKFVVTTDPFFAGLQHDIVEAGNEWYWWPEGKPTFDVFDEIQPDVLVTTEVTTSMLKCLKDFLCNLTQDTNNIILVQLNRQLSQIHVGNQEIMFGPMVDTHSYRPTAPVDYFQCQLARVGPIDNIVRRLCYPVGQYNIKIFGDDNGGGYGVAQYLGKITHQEECQVYASALLTYVETMEEALKVVACGGCPVSTNKDFAPEFCEIIDCVDDLGDLMHTWDINPTIRDGNARFMFESLQSATEHHYQYLALELLETINDIRNN
jgi:hypothetical protein